MINAEKNRDIALQMLNPSARDLEHGLELHKNSLVFDAYGFMPLCGGISSREKELVEKGASRDEVNFASEMHHMVEGFHDPQNRKILRDTWEYMTAEEKRTVICNVVEKIIVDGDEINIYYKF